MILLFILGLMFLYVLSGYLLGLEITNVLTKKFLMLGLHIFVWTMILGIILVNLPGF